MIVVATITPHCSLVNITLILSGKDRHLKLNNYIFHPSLHVFLANERLAVVFAWDVWKGCIKSADTTDSVPLCSSKLTPPLGL